MPKKRKSKSKGKQKEKAARPSLLDFDSALHLHIRGQLPAAETAYRALIEKDPLDARCRHAYGRLLHQQGRLENAVSSIQLSLKIQPESGQALNDLALLYQETGRLDDAQDCFRQLIKMEPHNSMAANNLGCCLKEQGRLAEAVAAFTQAAALDQRNANAFYNLGNTLKRLDDWDGAQAAYRQALEIDPEMQDIYPNLVAVLRQVDLLNEANEVLTQWLEKDPGNPIARHMQAAISQVVPPDRASAEYVRDIFDEFADTFDQQLESLDYRGPSLIAEAFEHVLPTPIARFDVLDAGCGTGACGKILSPHAQHLVGVDLSSNMLQRARKLGIYDDLITADLIEYLIAHPTKFDIIVSADTLGYFGDLQPLLASVRRSLNKNGILICTIETSEDGNIESKDFELMKTGRYRHSENYVKTMLAENGFSIEKFGLRTLRSEAQRPARCFLVLAVLSNEYQSVVK